MEVRGLGIINAAALFGVGALRTEKRLDLVITLKKESALNEMERVGLEGQTFDVLGIQVPHIQLPVAPGRDMAHSSKWPRWTRSSAPSATTRPWNSTRNS